MILKIIFFLLFSFYHAEANDNNELFFHNSPKKIEAIEKQKKQLSFKLQNKAFLKNAPRDGVQNDKDLLRDLIIEDSKLRSIVSSIN